MQEESFYSQVCAALFSSQMILTPWIAGQDQAQNSADLASSIGESSIVPILEDLDQQSETICYDKTLCNGPFHVFQIAVQPHQLVNPSEIFSPGFWDTSITDIDPLAQENLHQLVNLDSPRLVDFDADFQTPSLDLDALNPLPSANVLAPWSPRSLPYGESPVDLADFTFSTAKQLLTHYRETLVSFFTPAQVASQSPWETMYIPSVFSTVGEIGLCGNSSNAKVSLLFAIFAISAFSLDGRSHFIDATGRQDWRALGEMYRERANRRLKRSLQDLSSMTEKKKEKYKDILMALLSTVTICVGSQTQVKLPILTILT
jgi:hypothetical protein